VIPGRGALQSTFTVEVQRDLGSQRKERTRHGEAGFADKPRPVRTAKELAESAAVLRRLIGAVEAGELDADSPQGARALASSRGRRHDA
jgi:hypothetical protein